MKWRWCNRAIDLTGKRFGLLVVSHKDREMTRRSNQACWVCTCDCGNTCTELSSRLRHGTVESCGCHVRSKLQIDLTEKKFGKLLVVRLSGKRTYNDSKSLWECLCECGNTKLVIGNNLRRGLTRSCGCSHLISKLAKDETGKRYGKLVVVAQAKSMIGSNGSKMAAWLCKCDCGGTRIVTGSYLRCGHAESCGCDKRKELTGMVFGRLTVTGTGKHKYWGNAWTCKCTCGNKKVVASYQLLNGSVASCGCARSPMGGLSRNVAEYNSWKSIILRCTDQKKKDYPDYGGRGIKVCDSWRSFSKFFTDMGKRPSSQHSIHRIDNNGGYCKENCKWSTSQEQARNRRSSKMITFNGKTQCAAAWAEECEIPYQTLLARINNYGWSVEDAMTLCVGGKRK